MKNEKIECRECTDSPPPFVLTVIKALGMTPEELRHVIEIIKMHNPDNEAIDHALLSAFIYSAGVIRKNAHNRKPDELQPLEKAMDEFYRPMVIPDIRKELAEAIKKRDKVNFSYVLAQVPISARFDSEDPKMSFTGVYDDLDNYWKEKGKQLFSDD